MAVDKAAVKARLKIATSTTTYDDLIELEIDNAYANMYPLSGILFDIASGTFTEEGELGPSFRIMLKAIAQDAVLTALSIDGVDLSITDDVEKIKTNLYEITASSAQSENAVYSISYTSDFLLLGYEKLILDMVLYEVAKMPEMKGFIYKQTSDLDGIVSTTYVQPDYFYNQIRRRLGMLFVRYL